MPYFDYNATTPLLPVAREIWLRSNDEHWHNPSSLYRDAAKAKILLDNARDQLGEFLGVKADLLVFNSGATEGSHTILGYLAAHAPSSARIAVNRTEHPCLLGDPRLFWRSYSLDRYRTQWLGPTRNSRWSSR